MRAEDPHRIESAEQLRQLFGEVGGLAARKCMSRIDRHARDFIGRSPFLCLGSQDASGRADVTPRGDRPGFVQVLDDRTLAIPDRPGNNRIDTMVNILANPSVGLLFLIPGFEDTLRVNGTAWVSCDPDILGRAAIAGKIPRVAVCVRVEELFFHCAKALKRSRLWDAAAQVDRAIMPSLSRIIMEQTSEGEKITEPEYEAGEARLEEAYRTRLY